MISDRIDLCICISAAITVSSEMNFAFFISICKLTHVNIIERRDISNCSASTASSDKCQYVMVFVNTIKMSGIPGGYRLVSTYDLRDCKNTMGCQEKAKFQFSGGGGDIPE